MAAPQIPPASAGSDRSRISVEISPVVAGLIDHISDITGVSRAQIVNGALLDALPQLVARADALKKRQGELAQAKGRK
jgi:hypothetical protein